MITQDREPINKDARRALSSGYPSRVKTVEEAMSIAGGIIASPSNIKQVRQMIETGNVVKYQITIKKKAPHSRVYSFNGILGAIAEEVFFKLCRPALKSWTNLN